MSVLLEIIAFLLFLIALDLSNISSSIDDLRRSNAEKMSSMSKSIDNLTCKMQRKEGVKSNEAVNQEHGIP